MLQVICSSQFSSSSPPLPFPLTSNSNLKTNNQLSTATSSARGRRLPPPRSGAVESEEFDTDKARKALQQLDQQLQSLAQDEEQALAQAEPTKTTRRSSSSPYSDVDFERDVMTGLRSTEEMPEASRSYLSYTAVALLVITILNNILFNVFVKPSVDGNQEPVSMVKRVPLNEP